MKMSKRSRQGIPDSVPCLSTALLSSFALPRLVFSFWLSELPLLSLATLALFFFILFFKYISLYLSPFLSYLAVSWLCGSVVKFVLGRSPVCRPGLLFVCCIVQRSPQSPSLLVKYEHLENPDSWFHTVCTGKGLPLSWCVQFLCPSGHNY